MIDVQATVTCQVEITATRPTSEQKQQATKALRMSLAAADGVTLVEDSIDAVLWEQQDTYNEYLVTARVIIGVDAERAWERAGGDLMESPQEQLSAAEDIAAEKLSRSCHNGLSYDEASVQAIPR